MAELIREAALEGVRDELPHSLAVVIEEVEPARGPLARTDLVDVHAILYVERDSQKGIVIGKGGARLREVGTAARTQIEKLLGHKGLSRPTGQDRQELAARPQTAWAAWVLAHRVCDAVRRVAGSLLGHHRAVDRDAAPLAPGLGHHDDLQQRHVRADRHGLGERRCCVLGDTTARIKIDRVDGARAGDFEHNGRAIARTPARCRHSPILQPPRMSARPPS